MSAHEGGAAHAAGRRTQTSKGGNRGARESLINGQASTGPCGSPVFASAGKTEPPSRLILSQTSAGKSYRYGYVIADSSSQVPVFNDQTGGAVAIDLASKSRPWARTDQAMRASSSAIASTLRCSRFLAASIQDLSPWRSQIFGLIRTTHAAVRTKPAGSDCHAWISSRGWCGPRSRSVWERAPARRQSHGPW